MNKHAGHKATLFWRRKNPSRYESEFYYAITCQDCYDSQTIPTGWRRPASGVTLTNQ